MGRTLSFCLKVCCTTVLTAPWIYLLFTGQLNLNDPFTLSWLAFVLPAGLAFALPAGVIMNQLVKLFSGRQYSPRRQKLLLSVAVVPLCTLAMVLSCGWAETINIYYKLGVTYIIICIIFVCVYRLDG